MVKNPLRKKEKEEEKAIKTDEDTILEITNQCFNLCPYCYKEEEAIPAGKSVPLETLKTRIQWIKKNTDSKKIILAGGEPLMYDSFKELTDYILTEGFKLKIITGAGISKAGEKNIEHLLELFEQEKIGIELSYHPQRNEKRFNYLLQKINCSAEKVNDNHKSIIPGKKKEKKPSLFTTATFSEESLKDKQELEKLIRVITKTEKDEDFQKEFIAVDKGKEIRLEEDIQRERRMLLKNFGEFQETESHSFTITPGESKFNFKYQVRVWPAITVKSKNFEGFIYKEISKPRGTVTNGQMCAAMTASYDDKKKQVSVGTLTVKTDGEITFSQPQCISTKQMFGNIDYLKTREDIYETMKRNIEIRQTIVKEARASRQTCGDYCKMDSRYDKKKMPEKHVCPSCDFDITCNICNAIKTNYSQK